MRAFKFHAGVGALLLLVQALAFWPVWPWYGRRLFGQSGNGYALLALATGLLLSFVCAPRTNASPRLAAPAVLTALYAVLYLVAPVDIYVTVAFIAAATLIGALRFGVFNLPLAGLFFLSIPMMPWLQFYLGYPLRVLVTAVAAPLIRLSGLAVFSQGTLLRWGEQLISVDAPCSGIKMLWTAGYLVCTLCLICRLSAPRTLLVSLIALGVTVAANVLRAAALFYLEAGIVKLDESAHETAGMVVFTAAAGLIVFIVFRFSRNAKSSDNPVGGTRREEQSAQPLPLSKRRQGGFCHKGPLPKKTKFPHPPFQGGVWGAHHCLSIGRSRPRNGLPLLLACIAGCAVPLAKSSTATQHLTHPFTGWPDTFEGRALERLPMSDEESAFNRDFPGKMARFTDGSREIIMRWIDAPSRRVHAASHCLGAHGWRIVPAPLHVDADGNAWQSFEARLGDKTMRTREIFRDAKGRTWPDISTWYWEAALGKSTGPWWSIAVAESIDG